MSTFSQDTQFDFPSLLLTNRLVFATKKDFADYAEYPALMKNNPLSRLPEEKLIALERRLSNDFLEGFPYDSWDTFFNFYSDTSDFFIQQFEGKTLLRDRQKCALDIIGALFFYHDKPTNNKLSSILELIYDFEMRCAKDKTIDVDILILMVLGVLPPMKTAKPAKDPDFDAEWNIVRSFIEQVNYCYLKGVYEVNPIISVIFEESENRDLDRLFFIRSVCRLSRQLEDISHPQDIGEDFRYFYLDGLWQNCRLVNNSLVPEKDVYYEFVFKGQGYDFIKYEVFTTLIKYSRFHCQIYPGESTLMMLLTHPKASFDRLCGGKVLESHTCEFNIDFDTYANNTPERIDFKRFSGAKNFDVRLETLIKMPSNIGDSLYEKWISINKEDKYAKYSCIYPNPWGIYAITKKDIYLINPNEENSLYKVPKSIDDRLDSIDIDSMAGLLKVGESKDMWIGFEPIAKYIPPKDWDKLGIKKTSEIPVDTKDYLI